MDTSLEKASLYLQNDNRNSKSSIDGLTTLPECWLDCPDVVTGGNHSIGRYEHFTFIFHCSLFDCFSLHLCCLHLFVIVFSVSPFVLTATLRKSYEVALMAVGQKWPVLLYGPVGAGKTALINKLAQIVGNRGIYDIYL